MRRHIRKYLPDPSSLSENRWLRPFRSSLLHPRLWHLNRHSAAGAMAAGLFCGLIPGPFQMPAAALCALVFKINLPLAMLVTLYTNPLTLIPIYVLAYQIGRFAIGDTSPFVVPPELDFANLHAWGHAVVAWMASVGKPLGIGLVVLACFLAVTGYFVTKAVWRIWLIRAWRRRKFMRRK